MRGHASATSNRYFFVSMFIHQRPCALDAPQKIRVPDRLRLDEVNRTPEQVLEPRQEPEVTVGVFAEGERLILHEEVQVAALRVEAVRSGRAEHLQPSYLEPTAQLNQFLASLLDDRVHLYVSPLGPPPIPE